MVGLRVIVDAFAFVRCKSAFQISRVRKLHVFFFRVVGLFVLACLFCV